MIARRQRWAALAGLLLCAAAAGARGSGAPARVEIETPVERPLVGAVRVEARLPATATTARFLLDGEEVAETAGPPFATRLRLGRLPDRRRLEVVALTDGEEVARGAVMLNRGLGAPELRFVTPSRLVGAGSYDVELELDRPPGAAAAAVELYWNRELLRAWQEPPYRTRVELPPGQGFLRAVTEGSEGPVEATLLWLGEEPVLSTEAELVELPLVAETAGGRAIRDLEPFEVQVLEEGREQRLQALESPAAVPLTVALAVDLSKSVRSRFETIVAAVELFAQQALVGPDRAFVVTFGEHPELALPPTGDAEAVAAVLEERTADGPTALWDALAWSLVLLRDVEGRRAVVLLSDGADSCSRMVLHDLGEMARRVGVPIYLVWIRDLAPVEPRGEDRLLAHLVRRSGGAVLPIDRDGDLERSYRRIADDLLAQYRLVYAPSDPGRRGWREVEVKIGRPGVRARAPSGYWAEP